MAEVYFEFLSIPYFYDTKQSRLFQIEHDKFVEIGDPKIFNNVRFHSVEIGRERAFFLAQNFANPVLD